MEKWPNFFIVGAPKAGTSSLHEYLKKIPGVYMSTPKEPNYFSNDIPNVIRISDKEKYLELFKGVTNEKAIGESSTTYLRNADPNKIHQTIPHAKIIITLRNPVEHVHSAHLYWERNETTKLTFHEHVQQIWRTYQKNKSVGRWGYYEYVKKYLEVFEKKQVKIIIFEEWSKNPKKTIEELLKFLEVEQTIITFDNTIHNKYPDYMPRNKIAKKILQSKKINQWASYFPTSVKLIFKQKILRKRQIKPKMTQEENEMLIDAFHEDVEKLEKVLGRTLPWPNFHN